MLKKTIFYLKLKKASNIPPKIYLEGYFYDYVGATLTAKAFDTVGIGLGKWLITIASWFFAISTIMAWGYYGEQGIIYLFATLITFSVFISEATLELSSIMDSFSYSLI